MKAYKRIEEIKCSCRRKKQYKAVISMFYALKKVRTLHLLSITSVICLLQRCINVWRFISIEGERSSDSRRMVKPTTNLMLLVDTETK